MNKFPADAPSVGPHEAQFAKEVWEYLGCKDILTRKFIQVCFVAIKVFDFKQRHYGEKNIQRGGADGVRIRLGDKISRLDRLMAAGESPEEEPIEDTFGDIGNYGLIGLMASWGWWPGVAAHAVQPVKVSEK